MREHSESAKEYLDSTEPAVIHLFNGLDAYDRNPPPSLIPFIDRSGQVRMSKVEADRFVQNHLDFLSLEVARASLAGSILQIAYMALKIYSKNIKVTTEESELFGITEGSNFTKFCVGRKVHDIPIGLLVYAGRIHYNHWDEGEPTGSIAKNVFNHLYLAYADNLTFDMAYDLNYPAPRPLAHYILRLELKWANYDDYLHDMKSLLIGKK
jgi:hypothetical protein